MNSNNSPERTCIICREKKEKENLLRIVEQEDGTFLYDEKQKFQGRGTYVCKSKECIQRLAKHKKIKISMEELCKLAGSLKKENKDYFNILKTMRNSQALVFGMNMVFDEIEHIHLIIIAEDISEKNDKKLVARAKEFGIPYIYYGTKDLLGEIFGKDEVTVVAVNNKKMARGLLN